MWSNHKGGKAGKQWPVSDSLLAAPGRAGPGRAASVRLR
jgi:hypothetical protein